MPSRNLLPFVALLAIAPLAHAVPDEGGGYRAPPARPQVSANPTTAQKSFNIGFEEFEMAAGIEKASAAQTGEQATRMREAANAGYTRARDRFRVATVADPKMKEAWNMLGYMSRTLGQYEESLQAYNTALELDPNYPEATEYRAELFLLTGKLADAKAAHAALLKSSPELAAVLKASMQAWVKSDKPAPNVSAAERAEFAAWVSKL
jgi:Flp pilus assembly protein TadD